MMNIHQSNHQHQLDSQYDYNMVSALMEDAPFYSLVRKEVSWKPRPGGSQQTNCTSVP